MTNGQIKNYHEPIRTITSKNRYNSELMRFEYDIFIVRVISNFSLDKYNDASLREKKKLYMKMSNSRTYYEKFSFATPTFAIIAFHAP